MRSACAMGITAAGVALFLAGCSSGGDGPLALLRSRAEASFEVMVKVTYEIEISIEEPGSKITTTITQGPWGRRVDSSAATAERTYSGTVLDLPDGQYVCGLDANGAHVCMRAGDEFTDSMIGGVTDLTFTLKETLIESDEVEVVGTSSRQVAGIEADCFEITSAEPEPEEAEVCLSAEDILLSFEVKAPKINGTIVAIEVDRDVREEDFALPYPVVEAP